MQKLTNQGTVEVDKWTVIAKDATIDLEALQDNHWLVPLNQLQEHQETLLGKSNIGVWIDCNDDIDSLDGLTDQLPVIAIELPTFTDGRVFSFARMLREQMNFKGELRATGNFIQDQLFYLKRVGFDAFILDDSVDAEAISRSLNDFSDAYQGSTDEPRPFFRRRVS